MSTRSYDQYSELECLVLGMIALGATSGYAMRKSMQRMRGNRWSAGSGSIYRALRRLETGDLVKETGRVGIPNRQRIEYGLTSGGQVVLKSWLGKLPTDEEFLMISDPIRTRSYFLKFLEPQGRTQIVKGWLAENRRLAEMLRQESAGMDCSPCLEALALRSLLLQVEARQDWLKKLNDGLRSGEIFPG